MPVLFYTDSIRGALPVIYNAVDEKVQRDWIYFLIQPIFLLK